MKLKISMLLIAILVVVDQLLKLIIVNNFNESIDRLNIIGSFFSIDYVKNFGISFSMLTNNFVLIMILVFAVICFLFYFLIKNKDNKYMSILVVLILAGAIGNFVDRLYRGYVVDYLRFDFGNYTFPVFNLADVLVFLGCVGMFVYYYVCERNNNGINRR